MVADKECYRNAFGRCFLVEEGRYARFFGSTPEVEQVNAAEPLLTLPPTLLLMTSYSLSSTTPLHINQNIRLPYLLLRYYQSEAPSLSQYIYRDRHDPGNWQPAPPAPPA